MSREAGKSSDPGGLFSSKFRHNWFCTQFLSCLLYTTNESNSYSISSSTLLGLYQDTSSMKCQRKTSEMATTMLTAGRLANMGMYSQCRDRHSLLSCCKITSKWEKVMVINLLKVHWYSSMPLKCWGFFAIHPKAGSQSQEQCRGLSVRSIVKLGFSCARTSNSFIVIVVSLAIL